MALKNIAFFNCGYARWCARENQIASLKRE
jgi:hypothetical protein